MRLALGLLLGWGIMLFVSWPHPLTSHDSVPPAPADRAQRFGVYNWNIDDRAFTGNPSDRLNWGADRVAATGSRTIRVYLGQRDIYHLKSDGPLAAGNLRQLAVTSAYDKLFRDSRFSTYILTAYTYSSLENRWADGFTSAEYDAECAEIQALGEYLLGNSAFAGKTFIVINWEGDNETFGNTSKQSAWDSYLSYVEARADGVRRARASVTTQEIRLFSGLEFNLVRARLTNQACGTPVADPVNNDPLSNRCVIDYIAPRTTVDYYSYSSWQTITSVHENPARDFAADLQADVRFAVALVRARRPEVTEANFLIGEYGFERARFGECRAAELIMKTFEALNGPSGLGVSYAIFWQIVDNANLYGNLDDRFGLQKTTGSGTNRSLIWTLAGSAFKKVLADAQFQTPAECPGIKRPPQGWGVIDASSGLPQFHLDPDSVLSISSDTSFSDTGNTVHFAQSGSKSELTVANGGITNESATTIFASLPNVRRPGAAWVYVSNNASIDSNAQSINIECAGCPKIAPLCGVVSQRHRTEGLEPGSVISIRGSFQPQGNSVFVEQQKEGGIPVTTSITQDADWSESTTEITATLPVSLTRNTDASVTVVDKDGRPSASSPIFVPLACVDCPPTISPCLNYLSNNREFHPGTILSIPGDYPKSGNHVIIEYYNAQGGLTRQTLASGSRGWSETDFEISVGVPLQAQIGRAIIYVVDAIGRESSAWNIKITPATLAVVSAASFRPMSSTPGGIVAAFGNALATVTAVGASIPLPKALGGTTVMIKDSANVERQAALFFVSPQQINFEVSPDCALGVATITVQSADGTVSKLETSIVRVEPGIFAANADGVGAPAGDFIHVAADASQRSESTAVIDSASGKYIPAQVAFGPESEQVFLILYGTGLRLFSSFETVQVRVGGVWSEVTYGGPQGSFTGLDQINVRLPRTLIGRGLINVEVIVESRLANVLEVWIK